MNLLDHFSRMKIQDNAPNHLVSGLSVSQFYDYEEESSSTSSSSETSTPIRSLSISSSSCMEDILSNSDTANCSLNESGLSPSESFSSAPSNSQVSKSTKEFLESTPNLHPTQTSSNDNIQPTYSTITSLKCHPLYKIQEKIRSGGFGDVYKGMRRSDNTPIAIKIVSKKKINSWRQQVTNIIKELLTIFSQS